MEAYKENFINFMIESGVLSFGDFTTKSGRKTPFFINTGKYETAKQIATLGEFYAISVIKNIPCDKAVLYGPAYKGIPLVVTTAIGMLKLGAFDTSYCFNRKEAKDHGEGGLLIGHRPKGGEEVIIVEDVITAGTSIREAVDILKKEAPGVKIVGVIISVNRLEKGAGEKSAIQEISDEFGFPIFSIITIKEIVEYLYNRNINGKILIDDIMLEKIQEYREKYGAE